MEVRLSVAMLHAFRLIASIIPMSSALLMVLCIDCGPQGNIGISMSSSRLQLAGM